MNYYFRLQFRLLNRHIIEFGLPPWAGYLLGLIGFAGFSYFLFSRTELAGYILAGLGLSMQFKLSNARRNGFLRLHYPAQTYYRIRLLENLAIALPFVVVLAAKACYIPVSILLAGTIGLIWVNVEQSYELVFPTPFYRYPFEFSIGFRRNLIWLAFAYFLTFMGIWVDNFNLGAFSLLLVFLLCLGFYAVPEDKLYVWVHAMTPKKFLWHKTRIAWAYASLLAMPVLLSMLVAYWNQWAILLSVFALGCLLLTCMVWAKYANYPQPLLVPQAILLGLGLSLPVLLIGIMPFFFKQSVKRLEAVLIWSR